MELPKHIKTLTGIRGFAILWVVLFHLKGNPFFLSVYTPGSFIQHGFWGVDIFFVLSGFILAHVYEEKFTGRVDTKTYLHFLGLRLARLYPVHLVTFIAALGFALLSHTIGQGSANPTLTGAFMNLSLLHAWGPGEYGNYNLVSWAISAEWFAYIFLAIPLIRYSRRLPLSVLYAVTAVAWCLLIFAYVPTTPSGLVNMTYQFGILRIIPEFLGGYVAYRTARALPRMPMIAAASSVLGLTGIVAVVHYPTLQMLLLPSIMLLVIGLSAEGPVATRLLANRASLWLGERSYALYMCHFIVLSILDGVLKRTALPHVAWVGAGVIAGYSLVTLAIAALLYAFVEEPCRKWGRHKLDLTFGTESFDVSPTDTAVGLGEPAVRHTEAWATERVEKA